MVRAGAAVAVGERLGEGAQGVVYAAKLGGGSYAVKWYRAVPRPAELLRRWNCRQVPDRPALLQLPGGTLVLCEGAAITSHHLHRDRNHRRVIGVVEAHPAQPGAVVLRNVSQDDWTMTPDGEAAVTVPPQRRLGVRTMVIDFGPARGRIYTD